MENTKKENTPPIEQSATTSPEDPFVMYLILRESLKMSNGKMCISTGHAVQLVFERYLEVRNRFGIVGDKKLTFKYAETIFEEWQRSHYRKVALTANDKQWEKIKEEFKLKSGENFDKEWWNRENLTRGPAVMVIDLGLVEVAPNSETCIGLFPMRKSEAPKIIKRLQTLK